jgi:TetR/AcrR family transcriptional regulator, fatty acid metabolism regulator protein
MTPVHQTAIAPIEPAEPDILHEAISDKEAHLIRQAYRLIGAKGIQRMTLQEVADFAGVSKAVVIYYFKTKENLVLKTMRWVLAQVALRVTDAIEAAGDPEEKVRAMMDAVFVDALRNRNFYLAYTELIAHAARNDRFNELSTTFRSIVNGKYAQIVRDGVEAGAFNVASVDEAAMCIRAMIDGLFLQWLEDEHWRSVHAAYKEVCVRAVLAYLRGSPS